MSPDGAVSPASKADPARLFVAVWPPARVAAALQARCHAFAGDAAGRPEALERLHLTLQFLGPVPRSLVPALQAALCLPWHAFEIRLDRSERWPGGVLVMRPAVEPPALMALRGALRSRLAALGLRPDDRPFRPHVTLARRCVRPGPTAACEAPPVRWRVRRYVLAESVPGRPQVYRMLQACSPRNT